MTTQETPLSEATPASARANRPFTGDEYIESLRDGREVDLYGEKVKDVTTHPAFRNPVRMTARLYDALHDPDKQDVLTTPTDTGNGGFTFPFFRADRSTEDLFADQRAIAEWARITYGWMGRSPDYKASFLGTLGANAEFYEPFRRYGGQPAEPVMIVLLDCLLAGWIAGVRGVSFCGRYAGP